MLIEYEYKNGSNGDLITRCPHGRGRHVDVLGYLPTMVGSVSCKRGCPHHGFLCAVRQVFCNHRAPLTMPGLLRSSRFHGITHMIFTPDFRAGEVAISYTSTLSRAKKHADGGRIFNIKAWGRQGYKVSI